MIRSLRCIFDGEGRVKQDGNVIRVHAMSSTPLVNEQNIKRRWTRRHEVSAWGTKRESRDKEGGRGEGRVKRTRETKKRNQYYVPPTNPTPFHRPIHAISFHVFVSRRFMPFHFISLSVINIADGLSLPVVCIVRGCNEISTGWINPRLELQN